MEYFGINGWENHHRKGVEESLLQFWTCTTESGRSGMSRSSKPRTKVDSKLINMLWISQHFFSLVWLVTRPGGNNTTTDKDHGKTRNITSSGTENYWANLNSAAKPGSLISSRGCPPLSPITPPSDYLFQHKITRSIWEYKKMLQFMEAVKAWTRI